ncbi:tRNA guanosine(34) transglycosylase Tgt [Candidatus Gracilibacteria bacterium]|nr:tRNA guanosine(34) transglycosylase Tgt [Candidatus Gracilibacteria bacterium]
MFSFSIHSTDGHARAGVLETPHGSIQTPVFMPVGTAATIKGITREGIAQMKTQIMLSNTYHLMLRPGADIVEKMGGLHSFMNVSLPILTDSGGFQVFSLGNPRNGGPSLVKTDDEGVEFQSHLNGDKYYMTPEKAMDIQSQLGADIIMAFDDVAAGGSARSRAREALNRTHMWAERCVSQWQNNEILRKEKGLHPQTLFPIIQGVTYEDLRLESVRFLKELPTLGIAIGGLSVGEGKESMLAMLDLLAPELPSEKPHYLMGVGTPEDLIEAIARGVDMFDCVLPTRLGRHGEVFTSTGYLRVDRSSLDGSMEKIPVAPGFETSVSENYTLGYLRHLMHADEMLGQILLSMHNTEFLMRLCDCARAAIQKNSYESFRKSFWSTYTV